MNDNNWIVELANGEQDVVQCMVCGVAQDGSLIAFQMDPATQQPQAVKGFAPGVWKKFWRSMIRTN